MSTATVQPAQVRGIEGPFGTRPCGFAAGSPIGAIQLHARPSVARCPACHDDIAGAGLLSIRCAGCGVLQHEGCFDEVGGCSTHACPAPRLPRRRPGLRPITPEPAPRQDRGIAIAFLLSGAPWVAAGICICAMLTFLFMRMPSWVEAALGTTVMLALVASIAGVALGVRAARRGPPNHAALGIAAAVTNALPWIVAAFLWASN